ncbi:hypothetical protein LguiA_025977 [Lonicera macranthoides]
MSFVFGHYARLQVEIDLLHQQPSKLLVEREGYNFIVPVTFEHLPGFFIHCHAIGHVIRECRSLQKIQADFSKDKSKGVC